MSPVLTTDITAAAAALAGGELVAFATETVYGLGADAANPAAVDALYRAKKRPREHPVIVHLADFAGAGEWAARVPAAARALARAFMPGPLTLLLPRLAGLPHLAHLSGGEWVALRVPAHPLARRLLEAFGGGVAAPSANRFGALSPTSARHVAAEFAELERLLILDGGDCAVGIESTIVGFEGDAAFIVRPGDVSAQMIRDAGVALVPPPRAVAAPGTLARHYAPRTPLRVMAAGEIAEQVAAAGAAGLAVAVLSRERVEGAAAWRQAAETPAQYARELYRHLRELDGAAAGLIIVEQPPAAPEWEAINDRLRRAAAG